MPILKIANIKTAASSNNAISSNVSSSVSGNMNLIQYQISQKNNDYINVKNAVKILENYSNWNGYIKIYTEVENNFDVNDVVYITHTEPTVDADTINIENPSIPFADFYVGYKVLYVNKFKNEIVINRYYNDTQILPNLKIKNQYLSKISCRGGIFFGDMSDGVVFYNCDIVNGNFSFTTTTTTLAPTTTTTTTVESTTTTTTTVEPTTTTTTTVEPTTTTTTTV